MAINKFVANCWQFATRWWNWQLATRMWRFSQCTKGGTSQPSWHLAKDLSTSWYQNAFRWLSTAGWWQVASCHQTCYKLIVKICRPLELSTGLIATSWFQHVAISLPMTSCNKPDFNRLVLTWWNWQVCCNLLTSCKKLVRLTFDNLQ